MADRMLIIFFERRIVFPCGSSRRSLVEICRLWVVAASKNLRRWFRRLSSHHIAAYVVLLSPGCSPAVVSLSPLIIAFRGSVRLRYWIARMKGILNDDKRYGSIRYFRRKIAFTSRIHHLSRLCPYGNRLIIAPYLPIIFIASDFGSRQSRGDGAVKNRAYHRDNVAYV